MTSRTFLLCHSHSQGMITKGKAKGKFSQEVVQNGYLVENDLVLFLWSQSPALLSSKWSSCRCFSVSLHYSDVREEFIKGQLVNI